MSSLAIAHISNDWLGNSIQASLNHASEARRSSAAQRQHVQAAAQGLEQLEQSKKEAVESIQASAVQQAAKVGDIKESYNATLGNKVNTWA